MMQGNLFSPAGAAVGGEDLDHGRSGTFIANTSLPIHRWFRFSAGFSGAWAQSAIAKHVPEGSSVLDPFAGSGTTLLAGQAAGVSSVGFEAHPFVARVARAKLLWPQAGDLARRGERVIEIARLARASTELPGNELLHRCYASSVLRDLFALKGAVLNDAESLNGPESELLWLALTSILRECSGVGTANWQYLLPNKTKSRVSDPFAAFQRKVAEFAEDSALVRSSGWSPEGTLVQTDARNPDLPPSIQDGFAFVLTSPPYPNNFDYADATRLEMTFWGEVSSWGDLHSTVRQHLVRSCSQHSAAERLDLQEILADEVLNPIRSELAAACEELATVRLTRAGRKSYHTMAAGYFADLARVWQAVSRLCATRATACFVVGDAAPYGVHLPAERWLGELALAAGFTEYSFEKLRDRNTKWKNRKHRVPLHEGRLWVRR